MFQDDYQPLNRCLATAVMTIEPQTSSFSRQSGDRSDQYQTSTPIHIFATNF